MQHRSSYSEPNFEMLAQTQKLHQKCFKTFVLSWKVEPYRTLSIPLILFPSRVFPPLVYNGLNPQSTTASNEYNNNKK